MPQLMNGTDTSPRQSVRLEIDGEYFLSTFEESDAEALYEVLSIRSISNCLIRVPEPYTLENAKTWISGILVSQARLLAIPTVAERHDVFFTQTNPLPLQVIRHNGKLVGAISHSNRTNDGVVEMGYYLHPDHQGKGVMQAAGRKLLQYAANEFGIRRVFSSAEYVLSAKFPSQTVR
jgi:RimJ/RimL family protein N-acetyltransferase